jgi:hypothetical protein
VVAICDIDENRVDLETTVFYPPGADPNKPEQAAWKVGTRFRDATHGISIAVLKSTPTGYVVRVRVDP